MSLQNVALVGASGTVGPAILNALRASPTLTPFVVNRKSSKSVYPKTRVITIPDDLDVDEVARLFQEYEIDALVLAIKGSYVDQQKRFINAAFKGGVKRVIPAEFGSCDSASDATNELLPLMAGKKVVREYLQSLESKPRDGDRGNLAWSSVITGHFFDHGLTTPLLKFDLKARKAYLQDGGDIKFSGSNLDFIGLATVRILERDDETRNKLLYVHGHHVTQLEILDELESATGSKWERIEQDSEKELAIERPKMLDGDADALEQVVAIHGIVASDWLGKEGFANELLGVEEADLRETVRWALKEVEHQ